MEVGYCGCISKDMRISKLWMLVTKGHHLVDAKNVSSISLTLI